MKSSDAKICRAEGEGNSCSAVIRAVQNYIFFKRLYEWLVNKLALKPCIILPLCF